MLADQELFSKRSSVSRLQTTMNEALNDLSSILKMLSTQPIKLKCFWTCV